VALVTGQTGFAVEMLEGDAGQPASRQSPQRNPKIAAPARDARLVR